MLAHYRPGLTRAKILLIIAGGLFVFLAAAAAIESWSYGRLLKQGAVDTLDDLNYSDRFTSGKKPEAKGNSVADVAAKDRPTAGDENAPVQAVEFVDFSCPYSKEENSAIRELVAAHPSLIRLTVRNFPLEDIHPDARRAALAAMCADEQGKYWPMHDSLFANQKADGSFSDADLRRLALGAGVDGNKYDACLKSGAPSPKIQADLDAGSAAGVTGTPTFFVNGYKIDGAVPSDVWQKILNLSK